MGMFDKSKDRNADMTTHVGDWPEGKVKTKLLRVLGILRAPPKVVGNLDDYYQARDKDRIDQVIVLQNKISAMPDSEFKTQCQAKLDHMMDDFDVSPKDGSSAQVDSYTLDKFTNVVDAFSTAENLSNASLKKSDQAAALKLLSKAAPSSDKSWSSAFDRWEVEKLTTDCSASHVSESVKDTSLKERYLAVIAMDIANYPGSVFGNLMNKDEVTDSMLASIESHAINQYLSNLEQYIANNPNSTNPSIAELKALFKEATQYAGRANLSTQDRAKLAVGLSMVDATLSNNTEKAQQLAQHYNSLSQDSRFSKLDTVIGTIYKGFLSGLQAIKDTVTFSSNKTNLASKLDTSINKFTLTPVADTDTATVQKGAGVKRTL